MHFPALVLGLRRLGRWLVYELFRVALWLAFGLRTLASLRSALGGGGEWGAARRGPAIRPRRTGGGHTRPGRLAQSAAA
ncbi:hypothetical protein MUN81_12620 [Hymenobacter sp. 5317J-9]|uniref:hypothetical protein n=1 Tax=Hymenobacter sp. 5317J-9 TaxID=2932250 RepID=UPI001FD63DB8|nr:hypothetical protein [Hymenobacter sp. 5317J-9]UOQ96100.1 hypothetical protein MUN81_12620 [Hymenobacter sp. 5317J-9]